MKNKKLLLFPILLLIALMSYYLYRDYIPHDDFSSIPATGTIEARSVKATALMPGTIENFQVKEGDKVSAGQLIANLHRADLLAQKERDVLGVLVAESQLNDLLSGARAEEIKQESANLNIHKANLQKAEQDLERAEKLTAAGAISNEDLQQYQLNYETRKNQQEAAQARLDLLQAGNRHGLIDTARAQLEQSKAVVNATEAMLEDLNIYAPSEGIISSKNYENGEFINTGSALVTITDLSAIWVTVYIPTDQLPFIHLGQKATISVSGSTQVFNGTVIHINEQGEFTPKTIQTKNERANVVYAVKVSIQNQDNILKPGMPADVEFERGDTSATD